MFLEWALKIRDENFNVAVCLHAAPTIAWLVRAAGVPSRSIHFHGHTDRNLFSTVEIEGKGNLYPAIRRDGLAFEALFGKWPEKLLPQTHVSGVAPTVNKSLLVISPGASRQTKSWPNERFAEIAKKWIHEHRGQVALIGSPRELMQMQEIQKLCGEKLEIFDTLSVNELKTLLASASIVVGNDSGPKHLAISLGRPTVTIFGPENPFEWHPYDRSEHPYLFVNDLHCRTSQLPGYPAWCGIASCTEASPEKHRCMTGITVTEVWNLIQNKTAAHQPLQ